MSTYDPNLIKDRDRVRFLIGDTDNDFLMLEDKEIAYLLTQEGDDVLMASYRACVAIAGKFARDVNYRFSTMWQDSTEAFNHYMKLANVYEAEAASGADSALSLGFLMSPSMTRREDDGTIEQFFYGMHDNPPVDPAVD